uniref:TNFR-Cys domain-containing protein n=1 Tax=Anopheles minimus TaxID=112268 RepID=A0A182WBU1_9DIPT
MKYFLAALLVVVALAQLSSGACCPSSTMCRTCYKPVLEYREHYTAPIERCSCEKCCPTGYNYDGCQCVKKTVCLKTIRSHY